MHLTTALVASLFNASLVVNADFNGLRHPSRSRRNQSDNSSNQQRRTQDDCDGKRNNQCDGLCTWSQGSCVPVTPPGPPSTPAPTPASTGGPGPGPESGCSAISKAKACNDEGCTWSGGELGCTAPATNSPTTPGPTQAPVTPNPTSSPTLPQPTDSPTSAPTGSPTLSSGPTDFATYVPGDLTTPCDDGKLMLSTGMACKLLTTEGSKLTLADGTQSTLSMHGRADGAGVIPNKEDDGWYYASNSEESRGGGGVGVLRFASNGDLIGYDMTFSGTSRNCGGGVTAWGTWVTCEEDGNKGLCHEVDPHTGHTSQVNVVSEGGNYESFAYDDQDPEMEQYGPWGARFFTTEDSSNGALTRYTPHPQAFATNSTYDILTTENGVYEYLVLDDNTMTFEWSTSRAAGEDSAEQLFQGSEGIDVHNRILNFSSKSFEKLLTLDLEKMTWTESSTISGAFDLQPDQLGRMIGDGEVLYFAEDGGDDCDIHGRDSSGKYFTIVRGDGYSTETTGLAFSPNGMFMYVAFQGDSNVYSFWRTDGLPFSGKVADTKYHGS